MEGAGPVLLQSPAQQCPIKIYPCLSDISLRPLQKAREMIPMDLRPLHHEPCRLVGGAVPPLAFTPLHPEVQPVTQGNHFRRVIETIALMKETGQRRGRHVQRPTKHLEIDITLFIRFGQTAGNQHLIRPYLVISCLVHFPPLATCTMAFHLINAGSAPASARPPPASCPCAGHSLPPDRAGSAPPRSTCSRGGRSTSRTLPPPATWRRTR